jgi:hypothetical protein
MESCVDGRKVLPERCGPTSRKMSLFSVSISGYLIRRIGEACSPGGPDGPETY